MPGARVTLVGAGPGDPGLLTLAGQQAISEAEVVLYDRLVGPAVLDMIPPGATMIDVGKNRGNHPVPQDEINSLLITHALAGKRVVRLKGGDPYLFGRGAEELESLAQRGIPFRVVPGVTSALAAPAYAGIPVTHRNFSSSVHILTGHGKEETTPDIRYNELARLGGTLVFMMSVSPLGDIVNGLVKAGMDASTPAAIIENGTRDNQRSIIATISTIAEEAGKNSIVSPAVLVVGAVCTLASEFDWTRSLPLHGVSALAVSSAQVGGRLAAALRHNGCTVNGYAGIMMEPLQNDSGWMSRISSYGWIVLTSQYGVELFFTALAAAKIDTRSLARCKFAVVGERTAEKLGEKGIFPDCVPADFSGEDLATTLLGVMKADERALIFRAEEGSPGPPLILAANGRAFDEVAAYRTVSTPIPQSIADTINADGYDIMTFTSASAVRALVRGYAGSLAGKKALCIGNMTAEAARQAEMNVTVSPTASIDSMVLALIQLLGKK